MQRLAKAKLKQLRSQEEGGQMAWTELTRLSGDSPCAFENPYDISFVEQSALTLFCSCSPVLEVGIDRAIDSLYHTLGAMHAEPDGLLLLLSDLEEAIAYRVAVPVAKLPEITDERYECMQMDSGWYLSTFHFGDYYGIGMAYDKLIRYAAENSYVLVPPFLERYFLDGEHTLDHGQYITQILVKIAP